ncbi:hypothetical protein FNF28_06826 [Cafeteria roenbergensis]|uniref:Uncharacterized protein n=1 Tax=Cafeteria roenbergensis TaxID=33653 RepID=A0A5A8CN55_CAFRO|nr:hypothetical protein FNF28_06826 [Cafeteria roenbergensis]
MLDDDAVHAHLLANRGFVPMRPLDADPEFAGPFLEYFVGSWLQLLSAPYFWFVRGESVAFWFAARFKSTYRPGLAFTCLVVTVALSLAWGINPTEGYILLALHSYSSMLVAIHYGFLSPGQRQRFLSFSGVAQLKARKAFTEDPMTTAEILSGQPLAGHFISLNGALLRLLAESTDGTAATVLVGSDASPDAVSGDALLHNADDVMRSMSRYVHIPHADGEPAAGASGGNISPHAAGKGPSPGLLADTGKERPGDPRVRDGAPAQLATNARLALPAYSEALLRAYAHMLADEEKDAHDAGLPRDGRAAADASTVAPGEASRASAGPAKPFHGSGDEGGRLSGRGGGKPGAAPGAQLSVTELGSGSAEEVVAPAVQFAVPAGCDFSVAQGGGCFVDLRLPENACQWVAALDALLGHYEARDNVNSVEILSTIMAWNAVVVLAALLAALLIALGVVRLQLQSLVSLGLWGLIMGVGLGFAFVSEASSNELLETLSRHLQHIRTVMAEEVTSLRQAAMSRKWRSMTEKRQRGQSTGQASGSAVARRIGSFAGLGATELLETVYSDDDSPRSQNDAKAAPRRQGGLLRPESKKDFLERRAQHAMSTAESAAGLSSEQQTALADTIGNAMTVLDGKINELASGASRSRLFGLVISFTLLRGFLGALLATMLSLLSFIFSNR